MRSRDYPPFKGDVRIFVAATDPKEIGYINSIIEGYEGMGLVRTRDERQGIIEFWVAPDFIDLFHQVFQSLRTELPITLVNTESANHGPTSSNL
jgi:hypothetical protein